MKKLMTLSLCTLLAGVGCITHMEDHGEAGFRFGNELTFFSRASETKSTASASIDFKPTSDLVKSLRTEDEVD